MDLLIETPHRHGCLEVQGSAQEWWWQSSSHTALHLSCVHLTLITNDDGHQQLGRWLDPLEVRVAPPCQGVCCLCSQLDIFRAWVCSIGLGTSAMVRLVRILDLGIRCWQSLMGSCVGLVNPPQAPKWFQSLTAWQWGLKIFIIGSFWAAWTYHQLAWRQRRHEMAILAPKNLLKGPHPRVHNRFQKVKTFHTLPLHLEDPSWGSETLRKWRIEKLLQKLKARSSILCYRPSFTTPQFWSKRRGGSVRFFL